MAKVKSSSNPGLNPITSRSSPSSLLMQEHKQGSSVIFLLLQHQSHELQLIKRNWKYSHLELVRYGLLMQLDTDYTWGGIGTSAICNIWRCVLFNSWIHTEIFLGDLHTYTLDQAIVNYSLRGCQINAVWSSILMTSRQQVRTYLVIFLRLLPPIVRRLPPISKLSTTILQVFADPSNFYQL